MPPMKNGHISVCSKTIWVGNIPTKVNQTDLEQTVSKFGEFESINMIPPRGCAFIVMKTRHEANYAVRKMKHMRLGGKSLKCDWAPSKEMPDDQKKSWVKEHGVNYVPAPAHIEQFKYLSSWGLVDEESVPEQFKALVEPTPATEAAPGLSNHQVNMGNNMAAMSSAEPMDLDGGSPEREITTQQHGDLNAANALQQQHQHQQQQQQQHQQQQQTVMVSAAQMHQAATAAQQFAPISLSQRFPNHMPVIRMMPAAMSAQHPMQHAPRMTIMPIRMGPISMSMRPALHPAVAQRMAAAGHAGPPPHHMLTNHHLPPHQLHQAPQGFPSIRMPATMRPPPSHLPQQQPQHHENNGTINAIRPPALTTPVAPDHNSLLKRQQQQQQQ